MKMKLSTVLGGSIMMAGLVAFSPVNADELDKVVFGTNWYAQAEHGGFYQALATGLYEGHGLDVEIRMGGPQVNGTQLLVTGRYDLLMGYPIGNINAVEKGLPVMTVAASMQGDPQSLVAHPHVESIEQIKEEDGVVTGTDIALKAADIILVRDDLGAVPDPPAVDAARRVSEIKPAHLFEYSEYSLLDRVFES